VIAAVTSDTKCALTARRASIANTAGTSSTPARIGCLGRTITASGIAMLANSVTCPDGNE